MWRFFHKIISSPFSLPIFFLGKANSGAQDSGGRQQHEGVGQGGGDQEPKVTGLLKISS
jgi:hypothetical protein